MVVTSGVTMASGAVDIVVEQTSVSFTNKPVTLQDHATRLPSESAFEGNK